MWLAVAQEQALCPLMDMKLTKLNQKEKNLPQSLNKWTRCGFWKLLFVSLLGRTDCSVIRWCWPPWCMFACAWWTTADYSLTAGDIKWLSQQTVGQVSELGKQVISFTAVRGFLHSAALHQLLSGRHTKLCHSLLTADPPVNGCRFKKWIINHW